MVRNQILQQHRSSNADHIDHHQCSLFLEPQIVYMMSTDLQVEITVPLPPPCFIIHFLTCALLSLLPLQQDCSHVTAIKYPIFLVTLMSINNSVPKNTCVAWCDGQTDLCILNTNMLNILCSSSQGQGPINSAKLENPLLLYKSCTSVLQFIVTSSKCCSSIQKYVYQYSSVYH